MDENKYSNVNPNEFTQKDLMLHLLHVSQHTVTREELKEDIGQVNISIEKLEININGKIDKAEKNLNEKIDKLDLKIDKVEINLNKKIDKIDMKLDRLQWFIIAGFIGLIFKDFLF